MLISILLSFSSCSLNSNITNTSSKNDTGSKYELSSVIDDSSSNNLQEEISEISSSSIELIEESSQVELSSSISKNAENQSSIETSSMPTETQHNSKDQSINDDIDHNQQVTPAQNPINQDGLAQAMLNIINQDRINAGLEPLISNPTLTEAAKIRATEALYNPDLGHTRPNGSSYDTVFNEVGYTFSLMLGENLLFNSSTAETSEALVSQWRDNEGHYNNYMNPEFKYCGLAVSTDSSQTYALASAHLFATE